MITKYGAALEHAMFHLSKLLVILSLVMSYGYGLSDKKETVMV